MRDAKTCCTVCDDTGSRTDFQYDGRGVIGREVYCDCPAGKELKRIDRKVKRQAARDAKGGAR